MQQTFAAAPGRTAGHGTVTIDMKSVIENAVASVFEVEIAEMHRPTRGRANVALARQVAMYVAHVGCRLSLTDVGEMFDRDRTTVAHACGIVERRRDVAVFNEAIDLLELVVRVLVGPPKAEP